MKCPGCNAVLIRSTYAGAKVRKCPECDGMLVLKRRAEKIERRINKDRQELEAEVSNAKGPDLEHQIRCPECRNKMTRIRVNHLSFNIDECDNCGMTWFDAGELAQIQLAYESRPQTQEINAMRERLENMTDQERFEYERRIAELPDLGSPMQQALTAAAFEIARMSTRYGNNG